MGLKKVCRGKPLKFSKRGLERSQLEQPIKKEKQTNILTLPDLPFGFVHKRSGNEISLQLDFSIIFDR